MFTIDNLSSIKPIIQTTFLAFSGIIILSAGINLAFYLASYLIKLFKKIL